jgi:hypothetical protein
MLPQINNHLLKVAENQLRLFCFGGRKPCEHARSAGRRLIFISNKSNGGQANEKYLF